MNNAWKVVSPSELIFFYKSPLCSNDAFENACTEFDEVNLKPTYKILWGVPGCYLKNTLANSVYKLFIWGI